MVLDAVAPPQLNKTTSFRVRALDMVVDAKIHQKNIYLSE